MKNITLNNNDSGLHTTAAQGRDNVIVGIQTASFAPGERDNVVLTQAELRQLAVEFLPEFAALVAVAELASEMSKPHAAGTGLRMDEALAKLAAVRGQK